MTILKQCRSCIYASISWGKVHCNYGATNSIDVLIYNSKKECGHRENTIIVDDEPQKFIADGRVFIDDIIYWTNWDNLF